MNSNGKLQTSGLTQLKYNNYMYNMKIGIKNEKQSNL